MRLGRTLTAAVAALAFAGAESAAQASGNHWCRRGDPVILASAVTSCPFASAVVSRYFSAGTPRYWRGWVRSPITRKRYRITCRRYVRFGPATCMGANGIWARFSSNTG